MCTPGEGWGIIEVSKQVFLLSERKTGNRRGIEVCMEHRVNAVEKRPTGGTGEKDKRMGGEYLEVFSKH